MKTKRYFYQLFGSPKANVWSVTSGRPHSRDIHQLPCFILFIVQVTGSLINEVGPESLVEHSSAI